MKFLLGFGLGVLLCWGVAYLSHTHEEMGFHDDHKARLTIVIGYDPSLEASVQEQSFLSQEPKSATQNHQLIEKKVFTIRDIDMFLAVRAYFLQFRVFGPDQVQPQSAPPGK